MSFETPLPPYNASDPYATFLSSSLFDLLMIEMVPLAYRLASAPPQSPRTRVRDRPRQRERAHNKKLAAAERVDDKSGGDAADREKGGLEEEGAKAEGGPDPAIKSDEAIAEEAAATETLDDEDGEGSSSHDDDEEDDDDDEMVPITGPGRDGRAGYAGTAGPEGDSEEAERERAYKRCEGWGYRVGQGVVERLVSSLPFLHGTIPRKRFAL